MGRLVFTLRMWACILWASVLCLLPQTVQAQGLIDASSLLAFRDASKQSAIWDTWSNSDANRPCGWIGVSCTSDDRVQGLHFSGWGLEDLDLEPLTSLESLQQLDLSSNKFVRFPNQVGSLTSLTLLDVSGNRLFPIPQSSPSLTTVYNVWDISAANFRSLGVLQYLNLAGSNIAGNLPSLDGLVELKFLSLSDNNLTGSIPDLAHLANLVDLDLSNNQLTGSILNVGGLSTRLVRLRLANNQLAGEIPNLENLTGLWNLYLGGNLLTGFSETGFRSTSLRIVDISRNKLAGQIADGVGQMPDLQTLDLSWNNLTGPIPNGLKNIADLDLSNNNLSGPIPEDIQSDYLGQNCNVDLSANQLSGIIPANLLTASCMNLNLSGNLLVGIPEVYGSGYLGTLDLSNNLLNGPFPFSMRRTFYRFRLGGNQLSGDIIEYLIQVFTNHFWSTPIWREILLQGNQFTGDIATLLPALGKDSRTDNTSIAFLDLSYNSLNMTLLTAENPNPLQAMLEDRHMSRVNVLRLAGNNLSGISLPQTLNRSLPSLRILDLSDSFLEGNISQELFTDLGELVQFSVSMNRLSGGIPAKLPASLQVLEIGDNNLEGEIPDVIFTNLSSLLVFNASNNRFGKGFPSTLPVSLEVLDLSGNNFSGEIQAEFFFRLPNLTYFDVSNNNLSGPIPDGLPANVFNQRSFANNPGLCGGPLPACLPERIPSSSHSREWVVLIAVVVPTAFLVSLASCLLLAWKWRKYHKMHVQDADLIAIVLKRTLAIIVMPVRDLRRATNNFSESAKIGEGGGGTVYIGQLKDGTKVAVKVSKHGEDRERFAVDKQQFLTEVQVLSQVHHRHLVKLLGCSMQSNKAALVYEYVPNGTLEEHLRGRRDGLLSWKQRLLIALQTSEALAYLHTAAEPPIFHTDVKSSNILLDEDLNAKVSDFGISTLAPKGATYVDTKEVQGTIGYMDPEYFNTAQLTAKSDVYSFGAVLLELISGKSPRELCRGGAASLENVVISVMRDGDWGRLVDPCLREVFNTPTGRASIHGTCGLAAQCLAQTSEERPEMKEVRNQLQTLCVQCEASFDCVKQLPPSTEIHGGARADSPLLDFDYCQFSHNSTWTRSGSTGASSSGLQMVTLVDPRP